MNNNLYLKKNYRRLVGPFNGIQDFVDRGTCKDGGGLHGRIDFEIDGTPLPKFAFEENQFARFDLTEGKSFLADQNVILPLGA